MRLLAPAKINLGLRVLFRREDGYHEIYTVFQKVTLCDVLELWPADELSLEVEGPVNVPLGEENLCLKAARALASIVGQVPPVRIRLYKEIPTGAGLGGGSSDAAAVLKGLNEFWGRPLSEAELQEAARALGADVPFFVSPHNTALATGIGERLSPWPTFDAWYVLVFPGFEVPTAWAYKNLRLTSPRKPPNYERARPLWLQGLVNDFEPLVFAVYPVLKDIKALLQESGAVAALLTGSGATVYGIFESREQAEEAKRLMARKGFKSVVVTNY